MSEFDPTMVQIISASSEKELNKRITEIRRNHESLNPAKDVWINVDPNPNNVTFNDYDSKDFTVVVTIKNKDDD